MMLYLGRMLTDHPKAAAILDRDLIGFLTAVNGTGQPQTAPVWFWRDGDGIVVYNRPTSPRLDSVAANPKVSFSVRGDLRAEGALILEGTAEVGGLPPAVELGEYIAKYEREIERLGWTPGIFSDMYSEGLRITVTRVWAWGLDALGE
jgi:PPOX class probable F420-dependent enzyme